MSGERPSAMRSLSTSTWANCLPRTCRRSERVKSPTPCDPQNVGRPGCCSSCCCYAARRRRPCLGIPASQSVVAITPSSLAARSEEHTSELQSLRHLVCRLLLDKKNNTAPLRLKFH